MIQKELNRFEYIFLTKTNKLTIFELFKGAYQKLKVGDKMLCIYEGEEIVAYVNRLEYVLTNETAVEGFYIDEEKYGKLHITLSRVGVKEDYSDYLTEYFEYKKLLSESKKINFNILSRTIPSDISRTKIGMPVDIVNPLLMDNVISSLFNLPKRLLHNLMKQWLVIDTMDDEFVARKCINMSDDHYLMGIDAARYLYDKLKISHSVLKEEDIFVNEIYVYPQYWERMYVQDEEENMISFSYISLVNRCKYITMLRNDPEAPKLVLENETRMLYEKNSYLIQRFIHDGLIKKR